MSQVYDSTKPQSGVTTFGQLYAILRDHFAAVISNFSGTTLPTNPTIGQHFALTAGGYVIKVYMYTGNPSDVTDGYTGWTESPISNYGIGLEIAMARGSKLSLDQRLDVAMNEDGTLKAGTSLNPSQWANLIGQTFTYMSTTQFQVTGDQRDIYLPTRRLKINLAAGYYMTEVVSATYSAPNTLVTILDAVLTNTLVSPWAEFSIIAPRYAQNAGGTIIRGALTFEMLGQTLTFTNVDVTMGVEDFFKTIVINAATTKTVTLPTASAALVGKWVRIMKYGAGQLNITPNGAAHIEDGGAGLSLYCDQNNEANVTLLLVTTTEWFIIGGTGTWITQV